MWGAIRWCPGGNLVAGHEDVDTLARMGATRGPLAAPRRRRAFALQPANRTAAATGLSRLADFSPGHTRRRETSWQSDALTYYEMLPPVGFVMDYKATTVAACNLNVVDADETTVEGNEQIDRLMAALVGPRGGTSELIRRAAVLVEVTGEAYFVGTPIEDESEAVWWEFLSVEEIKLPSNTVGAGAKYRRDFGLGGDAEDLSDDSYIARFWRSDARFSARPACGLRRCLATCRELVLLSQMTEAIIASRLPMGLLLLPTTIEHQSPLARTDPASSTGDAAVGDDESSFMSDLVEHASAPITDFDSPSTLVPLVVQADREDLEAIRVVDLARNLDSYASGLRDEMYGRLAVGLDIPPEILQGKGGLNHWTGANVDNEFLFKHVQPVGALIADFLTYAYLRPLLIAEGMGVEQAADFTIQFDASPLANNQDDHLKAKDMWANRLISDRAVVQKQGWDPDSVMPEEDERVRRLVEQMVLTRVVSLSEEGARYLGMDPAWFALSDPGDAPAAPFGEPPDADETDGESGLGPNQPGTTPPPPDEPQPDRVPQRDAPQQQQTAGTLIAQLTSRADAVYDHARRTAGNRIIRASAKHPTFKGRFSATQTEEVPAAVGPSDLAALGLKPGECCDRGMWAEFRGLAFVSLVSTMTASGVESHAASDAAARIADRLVDQLHRWMVDGFHRPFIRYVPGRHQKIPPGLVEAAVMEASRPTVRVA